MTAVKLDIKIEKGATFRLVVGIAPGEPADVTGYTAAMQIRPGRDSEEVIAEYGPGEITVNNLTRQVVVEVPASETATYEWPVGLEACQYDLVLSGGGRKYRLTEGYATLSPDVTRED